MSSMLDPGLPPPLPPPRFSLRTLLLAVTAAGVFFGLFWWFSPLVVLGWAVAALMVAAHVAGNSLGTKLRDRASRRRTPSDVSGHAASAHQAPISHLSERWSLGWGMFLLTAFGALATMIGGCLWMERVYHLGLDLYGLAVAATAFGIMGGIGSFAVATFSQVMAVAFWQALRHK